MPVKKLTNFIYKIQNDPQYRKQVEKKIGDFIIKYDIERREWPIKLIKKVIKYVKR